MRDTYQERLGRFEKELGREEAHAWRLGWARAGTFLIGFLLYVVSDVASGLPSTMAGIGAVSAVVLFLGLVIWHRRVRARRAWAETMAQVNREAQARRCREWDHLPPSRLAEPEGRHPYAHDLDLPGPASLFRLLTTVTLPPGLATLRQWLLEPAKATEVLRRQEAVAELAPMVDFRQELEARGRLLDSPAPEDIQDFLEWAESESWLGRRPLLLLAARLLPLMTAALLGLFWAGWVSGVGWVLGLGVTFIVATQVRHQIHPLMDVASGGQERFGRYADLLRLLLEGEMDGPVLRDLQDRVRAGPVAAERELRLLARRVGWADIRFSPMAHAPLQAILAWDIHMLAGLERWKARSGAYVRHWLEALGELEALSALAVLRADHPDWCFPRIEERGEGSPGGGDMELLAEGLGHPLLPQDVCVRNDVDVGPAGSFLFVTGSNMSGKSTLLRAVGVNVVLAQAGGPVCARAMELSPLRVQTSMRTRDSLSEGVSQYMAELKRIRQVVLAAREAEDEAVIYLLDEPLQGTNEAERRLAVQTILGHLLDAGAIGAVATHDLQLDETERLRRAARAVHLAGEVGEGDAGPILSFDYLLRPGRATSTNALALLRAVGLGEASETGASGF